MTGGMVAMQSRVSELQTMLGLKPAGVLGGASSTSATSATGDFAGLLADALGGTGTSGAGGASSTGSQAVALAQSYAGVPYLWGGTDPAKGLDCSGLTQLVYSKLGVTLPRVAADQAKAGTEVGSLSQAQPGDLVFFGSPAHHVGIYVGNGQMIDAPHAGATVGVHQIAGYGAISQIRRVTGTADTAAGALGYPGVAASSNQLLSSAGLSSLSGASGITGGSASTSGLSGPYASLFTAAGQKYGVDPALLSAVAKAESNYNPSAVSSAGAQGLMQLMPATARSLGVNPAVPAQAVDGAAKMISGLLKQFGGRVDLALAGYNAGAGAVQRYGGVPPYPETRTYVQRVTSNWKALQ